MTPKSKHRVWHKIQIEEVWKWSVYFKGTHVILPLQRWARAYRDTTYHAAVDMNNGVEAQNKLLKYNYLPRRKQITLSEVMTILVETFLPETYQKYLFQNYAMTTAYRSYNDIVPDFLDNWTQWALRHNKQRYKLYMYKDPRLCYKACYIYILLGWGPNVSCSSRGNCYSTGTEGAFNPRRCKLSFLCLWLLLPWEWDDALQDTNATVTFFAANRDRFKGIVLDGDVENHVRKMQHLTVWGTQVELQAAASLYQVPVYLLIFSKQLHKYTWQCYQPWDSSKLNFPETEPSPTRLSNLDHVELLHLRGCHFDCILHWEGGFSLDRPVLEGRRDRLFITLD